MQEHWAHRCRPVAKKATRGTAEVPVTEPQAWLRGPSRCAARGRRGRVERDGQVEAWQKIWRIQSLNRMWTAADTAHARGLGKRRGFRFAPGNAKQLGHGGPGPCSLGRHLHVPWRSLHAFERAEVLKEDGGSLAGAAFLLDTAVHDAMALNGSAWVRSSELAANVMSALL